MDDYDKFDQKGKNHLAIGEHANITDFKTKHFLYLFLLIRLNNVYSNIHYNYKNGQTKCFEIIFKTKWVDSTICTQTKNSLQLYDFTMYYSKDQIKVHFV